VIDASGVRMPEAQVQFQILALILFQIVSENPDPQLDWKPDERGKGLATKKDNTHRHNNKT